MSMDSQILLYLGKKHKSGDAEHKSGDARNSEPNLIPTKSIAAFFNSLGGK